MTAPKVGALALAWVRSAPLQAYYSVKRSAAQYDKRDAAESDLRALMARCEAAEAERDAALAAERLCSDAQVAALAERDAARADADALAAALDDVLKVMWHPESAGRPPLDNMDRWRVVEVLRAALTAHRARVEARSEASTAGNGGAL